MKCPLQPCVPVQDLELQMKLKDAFNSFTIVGTVTSTLIGVLFHVAAGSDPDVSFLVGLVFAILTFQIDLVERFKRRDSDEHTALTRYDKVWRASPFSHELTVIIDHCHDIGITARSESMLLSYAQQKLGDVSEELCKIAGGRIELDYWNSDLLIAAVLDAKFEILAVSPQVVNEGWWNSREGTVYMDAHVQALKKGVRITRVFLFDDAECLNSEIMSRQANAGIEVLHANGSSLPSELKGAFVIFDDRLIQRTIVSGDQQGNLFSINAVDLARCRRSMSQLRGLATPFRAIEPNIGSTHPADD